MPSKDTREVPAPLPGTYVAIVALATVGVEAFILAVDMPLTVAEASSVS